jgi:DNA-binding MarR family transcriptional regulator
MNEPRPVSQTEQVASALNSAAIHLLRRLRKEDTALGLSAARLSALSVVGFGGPQTLSGLAAAEQVSRPTMSRIVAALERARLVERIADEGDGRVQWIHITPNGKTVLERGRGRRIEQLALLLRGLPASEIALLGRAAEVIEDVLRK